MIHVGISCEFLGSKRCGTATYSQNLLSGLALVPGGYEFYPYLAVAAGRALVPEAAHVTPRMVPPYNALIRLAGTLPLELLRRPVDLLHAQGWGPLWSPCPIVLTVHDIGWESFPEIYPRALALRLSLLVRASVARAVRVIASSHYTAADLVRIYRVPAERVRVVYPPLGDDIQHVADPLRLEAMRLRYNISGPYILYVGSIEPKKNVHRLIQAYAALRRERETAHTLVIAGKPLWLSEPILQLPAQLGIEQHVVFTGAVADEDRAPLYSAADAFAFLGMYEGFGYPPLEAMLCQVPVLAAARTSLPEVLGDAALLVDPDDQGAVVRGLARLLDDQALRASLRERGLRRCQQFRPEVHAQQVCAVYDECAAMLPKVRKSRSTVYER